MGEVYLARDEQLERDVAIKILPAAALADESARKRLRKEAIALSRLNHPNIATIYEVDTQDQVDFLVMEYVPGVTLGEKLSRGALPEKEIIRLGTQLAEGLAAAHSQGVVHCDLKPGNLAVMPDGRLKILDFGLAKLLRPSSEDAMTEALSKSGGTSGTLPYMSPEQLRGEPADTRSDLYAAGVVLYEMATGQRLVAQSKGLLPAMDAILYHPAPRPSKLNPQISSGLESIILKCVEKDSSNRYQSAIELAVDLRRWSEGGSTAVVPPPRVVPRFRLPAALVISLVAALLVAGSAVWWRWRMPGITSPLVIQSLAVIPLENLSNDREQDYFADGMTDALITDLSKIRAVRVISRASVTQYKGAHKPVHQIGRELNVDAVVSGTVMRSDNRVRISVELADAQTDRNFWAESYEGDIRGVIDLQSQVVQAIAHEIRAELPPQKHEPLASRSVNPQAYEAYLRGRYSWNKRTPKDLRKGVEYFQKAIEIDPTYTLAYAGLADSYILLEDQGELPPREAMPVAKAAAKKALDLDESLAEAHASLAAIEWTYDWDLAAAGREFERALSLDPNYATARQWYGLYLTQEGRFDEAIAEMQYAHELDPLSLIIEVNVGRCYYYARRYDQAVELLQRLQQREPDFWIVHMILGQSYLVMGRLTEAIRELERSNTLLPDYPRNLGVLGDAYGRAERRSEAQKLAHQLAGLSRTHYVSPVYSALIHMGLGDKLQAFAFLEKAYAERSDWMPQLNTEPEFDLLRTDLRFRNLLRRIAGQPQEEVRR